MRCKSNNVAHDNAVLDGKSDYASDNNFDFDYASDFLFGQVFSVHRFVSFIASDCLFRNVPAFDLEDICESESFRNGN